MKRLNGEWKHNENEMKKREKKREVAQKYIFSEKEFENIVKQRFASWKSRIQGLRPGFQPEFHGLH
jgi:hypothetical protein